MPKKSTTSTEITEIKKKPAVKKGFEGYYISSAVYKGLLKNAKQSDLKGLLAANPKEYGKFIEEVNK